MLPVDQQGDDAPQHMAADDLGHLQSIRRLFEETRRRLVETGTRNRVSGDRYVPVTSCFQRRREHAALSPPPLGDPFVGWRSARDWSASGPSS